MKKPLNDRPSGGSSAASTYGSVQRLATASASQSSGCRLAAEVTPPVSAPGNAGLAHARGRDRAQGAWARASQRPASPRRLEAEVEDASAARRRHGPVAPIGAPETDGSLVALGSPAVRVAFDHHDEAGRGVGLDDDT